MESSNQAPINVENSQKEQRSNMESSNHAPSDVENPTLATSMKSKFKALPHLSSECCIYRVPERLRSVNEKAYTPQVVSIGPLHHGKDGLKAMEEHKRRYLYDYIERTGEDLERYIEIVRLNESSLRSCYEEIIEFSSEEFVEMVLVDSAFIIEILLRYCIIEFQKEKYDRIFHKPWMIEYVWPDLQLLENQLPFFILEKLFDKNVIKYPSEEFSIDDLSFKFFIDMMDLKGTKKIQKEIMPTLLEFIINFQGREKCEIQMKSSISLRRGLHFVDLRRNLFIPEISKRGGCKSCIFCERAEGERAKCERLATSSITELDRAGVKFEVNPTRNLLYIFFEHEILKIPKLRITDSTELTMRNLAAFEQCHYERENRYICHYLKLLDDLVNTEQDVDLLVKKQIIENWLGESKNVSDMINKLVVGINIDPKEFYFGDIFNQLNKHYNYPRNHWKANLKQNYFNTPWAVLSVIAAVLIIILTVIQAVCSIISAS